MSDASCLLSEEQFLCSICLDLFNDPITTPCGHNFCKNCITQHWDVNHCSQCPLCKKYFDARPELQVNTFVREMVAQFRLKAQVRASSSSSEQQDAKPGEIPCDVCTGTKLKALKTCLACLLSYCEIHMEPHLTAPRLMKHQLMEPVKNLDDMVCKKHDKPLELFCKTDHVCICSLCSVLAHNNHKLVPLSQQYEVVKVDMKNMEPELQQRIQNNRLKIQEIKELLKISKDAADRERAEGVQIFTALKESVEKALEELITDIENKQKTTEKQAEDFIKDLEQEISELMKRSSEVIQLSQSEDHLSILQNFYSLKTALPTKNFSIHPPSYEGIVVESVKQLERILMTQIKTFCKEAELKRVRQYAVDVTLDPETAHPALILSDDEKHVHCGRAKKKSKKDPKRFTLYHNVLGKQSFSTGKFYFEVRVRGKNHWTLGVARESVDRNGPIQLSPENGYWTIGFRRNKYKSFDDTCSDIHYLCHPRKVGVFVDFEKDQVSFYNVNDSDRIYTFYCCLLSDNIYPFFSPGPNPDGENSVPLFISPVPQTH